MDKVQKDLAKVIENYFGADAGYLDIDCFTLASRIIEAGWTKPVLCKDCKHCTEAFDGSPCCGRLRTSFPYVRDGDFCSYGERRNDG